MLRALRFALFTVLVPILASSAGALLTAGCALDSNGTGELMGNASDGAADSTLPPDGEVAGDAASDAPGQDSTSADGAPADAANAGDAGDAADVSDDAADAHDAEDGEQDVNVVEPTDATDCDAGACVADAGDAGEAGADSGQDICDMDHDGVLSVACGGNDCCDSDPQVFPGQTTFFATLDACGSYDYNCDGVAEKRWTSVGSGCHLCYVFACCTDDGQYLSGPPDCGQSAEVGGCGGWPDCNNNGGSRQQMCR